MSERRFVVGAMAALFVMVVVAMSVGHTLASAVGIAAFALLAYILWSLGKGR